MFDSLSRPRPQAFRVRGKALALLGRWKEAAKDLGDAQVKGVWALGLTVEGANG